MVKLVILRIGEGNFETGFPVCLRIAQAQAKQFSSETEGKLAPAPKLYQLFTRWQSSYRNLAPTLRLGAPQSQITNISVTQCREFADELKQEINQWLTSADKDFQKILFDLFQNLNKTDEIQLIIQTDDWKLWQLPWSLWTFFESYPLAEIALSRLNFSTPINPKKKVPNLPVKILAILGDSTNIDVTKDRQYLTKIPQVNIAFLEEPKRKEFEILWEKDWQILFFAGHSYTENNGKTGVIFINPKETLNINQLRNTLTKAISNGLKLAIFNSCDGLGLAYNLAELNIPNIIVMREPVPDLVAQEFLKHFLSLYSRGQSLYNSVKEAKAKLQELSHLEDEAPGVTLLPVIYQNLGVLPPSWQDLIRQNSTTTQLNFQNEPPKKPPEKNSPFNIIISVLILVALISLVLGKNISQPKPTRKPYQGLCECPYDFDKAGGVCGKKSAYHRPGGNQPMCYINDL